jgi:hypothetical protein
VQVHVHEYVHAGGGRVAARWLVAMASLVVVTCAPRAEPVVGAGSGSPPELGSSLNVRVVEDTVVLELHITNVTDRPLSLEFSTTQRYDFAITTLAGEGVWHWSAARSFAQAEGTEALRPGESRRFSATWPGGGRVGDYVATAWVVSANYPVELRTGFQLPSE